MSIHNIPMQSEFSNTDLFLYRLTGFLLPGWRYRLIDQLQLWHILCANSWPVSRFVLWEVGRHHVANTDTNVTTTQRKLWSQHISDWARRGSAAIVVLHGICYACTERLLSRSHHTLSTRRQQHYQNVQQCEKQCQRRWLHLDQSTSARSKRNIIEIV